MSSLSVISTRGELIESVHRVSVAVVQADGHMDGGSEGRVVAQSGDPGVVTYWRSAAKPFQALPLVEDGAADHFKLSEEELALSCASHSSEKVHLDVTDGFLAKIGCTEADLACGPHPPLGPAVADQVIRQGIHPTPRWNNCSGKHSGMLALAKHHGWPTAGYNATGHPVQQRILQAVTAWTDVPADRIVLGVDGCTAINFALPLSAMALAYARLGVRAHPAAERLRNAMMRHPHLVAGTGRACTDLMRAYPGQLLAKLGAEGVYCAALPSAGLGLALKVEDGDMRAASIALFAVLDELFGRFALGELPGQRLPNHARVTLKNTRGAVTGEIRAEGKLEG